MAATPQRLRQVQALVAAQSGPDAWEAAMRAIAHEPEELQQRYLDALCDSWLGRPEPRWPRSDGGLPRGPRDWHYQDMTCEVCEGQFTPSRWDALYCSGACRQKAYRRRITAL